ncbi:MAG: hypothetical protein HQ562_08990 [Candidatus Marinimicrobia bacterium]|nr:hypothetical protein [Candidatus Neomarinimicrobiota bacterium]
METKNPVDLPQIEDLPIDADSIEILWKFFRYIKEWSFSYKKIHGKLPESSESLYKWLKNNINLLLEFEHFDFIWNFYYGWIIHCFLSIKQHRAIIKEMQDYLFLRKIPSPEFFDNIKI